MLARRGCCLCEASSRNAAAPFAFRQHDPVGQWLADAIHFCQPYAKSVADDTAGHTDAEAGEAEAEYVASGQSFADAEHLPDALGDDDSSPVTDAESIADACAESFIDSTAQSFADAEPFARSDDVSDTRT